MTTGIFAPNEQVAEPPLPCREKGSELIFYREARAGVATSGHMHLPDGSGPHGSSVVEEADEDEIESDLASINGNLDRRTCRPTCALRLGTSLSGR